MTLFYSLIVIFSWGSWIAVVQTIPFKNQQIKIFYISLSNLVLAFFVALFQQGPLFHSGEVFLPFIGGVVWAVSGYFAMLGTENIGLAKAQGIWAPINIGVSIIWGVLLFGEFLTLGIAKNLTALTAVVFIIAGILFIVFAGDEKKTTDSGFQKNVKLGYLGAIGAGLLWGSYFIPIRISGHPCGPHLFPWRWVSFVAAWLCFS